MLNDKHQLEMSGVFVVESMSSSCKILFVYFIIKQDVVNMTLLAINYCQGRFRNYFKVQLSKAQFIKDSN